MQRRSFVKSTFGAAGLGAAGLGESVATNWHAQPNLLAKNSFKLKYAPHIGMFENSAGKDPIDQLKFMADMGFTALEDNGMMGREPAMQEKMGKEMARLGITMGVFVLDKGGNSQNTLAAGKPEYVDIFLNGCRRAVETAKRVNAKWTTVVPGDFERNLPIGIQTGNVIDALRRGAEILEPAGIVMVLEPLSDSPNLFLRTSDQTYEICRGVNSPSCKLLFDIYHMQKNEGHIIPHINWSWNEIAYFQIGDNPGRNEPTTGEINYKNIFKHVYQKAKAEKKEFIFGMEHGKSMTGKEGELALIKAYVESDSFTV
ncbi:hydroxypyruvate isomerase family protein [Spirosoma utsteinense]|uniref:Hydroxypyruvate isomerase n=1 Tax=Spirosoma utsteinense TaxID=2585773 RepID=A0ABR6W2Y9_9BACT|nr:TIM barrel protein [Spirosoma utsteinense]MBC3784384.1 hydroxypyruvate isomerase [Spirosoma utsteinense]MBC3790817.1 hydroxypyruvate isomerase [Spirosoma utsteinense]